VLCIKKAPFYLGSRILSNGKIQNEITEKTHNASKLYKTITDISGTGKLK
jgi:hypothetical protein